MSWVVSTQPQTVSTFNAAADWSSGICDCCQDMNQCCFAFWCFPCFACKTSKDFGQCLCLPLLDVFGCFIHPITMSMRVSMRHVYGIRGSLCDDCLCSTFCVSCVWCQMATEIKKRQIPTMLSDIISSR
ncbi:cornifelin homolog B-like isoform X2 [Melanotaenia boesemani]|uniref:cornifelin homolog B-like isoform X2 n=1 Tax=Melanotaenia boesemani TaxID=1250792 RepID=UPI001C04877A|nr:cornifelin homolog B-like isoform X2 [Melanotaenia boesemani]